MPHSAFGSPGEGGGSLNFASGVSWLYGPNWERSCGPESLNEETYPDPEISSAEFHSALLCGESHFPHSFFLFPPNAFSRQRESGETQMQLEKSCLCLPS